MICYDEWIEGVLWGVTVDERGQVVARERISSEEYGPNRPAPSSIHSRFSMEWTAWSVAPYSTADSKTATR
jgi:hypothetical protein